MYLEETDGYHLRDGTGGDGTVTSPERFSAGQVTVARGAVTVDKDLGYGYFYPVILENVLISSE